MSKEDAKHALTRAVIDAFGPEVAEIKTAALSDAIAAYVVAAIADNNAAKQNV